VLVAMSGGVDSSVAALLLKQAGAEVIGVTFRNYCFDQIQSDRNCCSLNAAFDALAICEQLGLRHMLADETDLFRTQVIDNFHDEYRLGRTPNPCIRCNSRTRFPRLLEIATEQNCDFVATGHYARIVDTDAGPRLACGLDTNKDQSYFLAEMTPESYSRILFPLGTLCKGTTRALAREAGFALHEKKESQDICFLGDRNLRQYLADEKLLSPGDIIDRDGNTLGRHPGVELYTVGQRRGLGVAAGHITYVTRIDAEQGTVTLGNEGDLLANRVTCLRAWLDELDPGELKSGEGLSAKIRYRSPAVRLLKLELRGEKLEILFAEPVKAVAPGQSLVVYRGDLVVGHGIIDSAESV
jgi:tRNA-uridine 2-sulfurtransferase